MQYFLYDSYFINFLSLFLNGFIILLCGSWNFREDLGVLCVCLFVCGVVCFVLFCWNHFARGENGRKQDVNANHVIMLH